MYTRYLMGALLLAAGIIMPSQTASEQESNYVLKYVKNDQDCFDVKKFIHRDGEKLILGGIYVYNEEHHQDYSNLLSDACDARNREKHARSQFEAASDRVKAAERLRERPILKVIPLCIAKRFTEVPSEQEYNALETDYQNASIALDKATAVLNVAKHLVKRAERDHADAEKYPYSSEMGWKDFADRHPDLAKNLSAHDARIQRILKERGNPHVRVCWGDGWCDEDMLKNYIENCSCRNKFDLTRHKLQDFLLIPQLINPQDEDEGLQHQLFISKDALKPLIETLRTTVESQRTRGIKAYENRESDIQWLKEHQVKTSDIELGSAIVRSKKRNSKELEQMNIAYQDYIKKLESLELVKHNVTQHGQVI